MSLRAKHSGHLEYLLVTEAIVADVWFADFRQRHDDDIRSHSGNGQSYGVIVPPGAENVIGYFDFELHYEVADQAAVDALVDEVEAAIVIGTYATARGASTHSTQGE